jgi:hypothetical protein
MPKNNCSEPGINIHLSIANDEVPCIFQGAKQPMKKTGFHQQTIFHVSSEKNSDTCATKLQLLNAGVPIGLHNGHFGLTQ